MFTEYEIETILEIPEINKGNLQLKKEFLKTEAHYLEISDHDFFSLVMMSPSLGIAIADGNVSLFEELQLNKKARKLSKGTYFMKKDPVVYAMKFLIKRYDKWSEKFTALLKKSIELSVALETIDINTDNIDISYESYKKEVLRTPYILIRFIAGFFLEQDEDIISDKRSIKKSEYQRLLIIGEQLGIKDFRIFKMFCKTFNIKG